MFRLLCLLLSVGPAYAQTVTQDQSLQEQMVAGSFILSGSAIVKRQIGETIVNYSVTNKTGINLYLATTHDGISLGSCQNIRLMQAGLPPVPSYVSIAPDGVFVPASGRVSGSFALVGCPSPNPGFPTAPMSVTLMISKTNDFRTMFPLSIDGDIPVRVDSN